MDKAILLAVILVLGSIAYGDEASDRFAEAQRRLAEKQAQAKVNVAATRPAATKPSTVAGPRRIVFIIDARGSLQKQMDEVRKQVMLGISDLKPDQSFGLVVMQSGVAKAWKNDLVPATAVNTDNVWRHLQSIEAEGPSRPSVGFEAAAKMRPDLAWFISTGMSNLESSEESIAAAKKAKVKVNTILHFADPENEAREMLRQIASVTGGICLSEKGEEVKVPLIPSEKPIPPKPTGPSVFQPK